MSQSQSSSRADWQARCRERKQKQLDSIPRDWLIQCPPDLQQNVMDVPASCGLLSPVELAITESPVESLLPKLATGEWSSVDPLTSNGSQTNCLTEIFVERALKRAHELDEFLNKTGTPMGPLHGLPISLKACFLLDQFCLKGLETIMGYVAWIGDPADHDCVLAQVLYDCGANPFVRTNVPQTLIWGETYNHVFGRTVNPHNRLCTPGGSSGGEGALLALKGSPLGIGTDIGGSVRIPSAFCGLYALRPSYERFPYQGTRNSAEGQESISSVLGPMAASLGALKLFTKAILDSRPWIRDPLCIRKPWSQQAYELADHGNGRKLCFAMMWDNEVVKPHPPVYRAMRMVKHALEAAGHKVIDWKSHIHMDLFHNVEYIWAADGAEDFQTMCNLSGEPLVQLEDFSTEETRYLNSMEMPPMNKLVVEGRHALSTPEVWHLHKEKRHLRKAYLDHWNSTSSETGTGRAVDAIISPTMPYGMTPHGLNTDAFYTTLFNILDYPAICFPVTTVDRKKDNNIPMRTHFYNHEDEAIHRLYDVELFQGSPIGIQVIGRTHEEEAVLAMAEIIDDALAAKNKTQS